MMMARACEDFGIKGNRSSCYFEESFPPALKTIFFLFHCLIHVWMYLYIRIDIISCLSVLLFHFLQLNKEEKFICKALDKGEGALKMIYMLIISRAFGTLVPGTCMKVRVLVHNYQHIKQQGQNWKKVITSGFFYFPIVFFINSN